MLVLVTGAEIAGASNLHFFVIGATEHPHDPSKPGRPVSAVYGCEGSCHGKVSLSKDQGLKHLVALLTGMDTKVLLSRCTICSLNESAQMLVIMRQMLRKSSEVKWKMKRRSSRILASVTLRKGLTCPSGLFTFSEFSPFC